MIAGSSPESPFNHQLHMILRASTNESYPSDFPIDVGRKSIGKELIDKPCYRLAVINIYKYILIMRIIFLQTMFFINSIFCYYFRKINVKS